MQILKEKKNTEQSYENEPNNFRKIICEIILKNVMQD